ncbi:MAG: helix-turn-helix transcriptional regulator [Deltaproteobacteria bacterium]|nr:helix-turn-helix transcriptional regulator [Deltaproteobacteria bacterium]
MSTQIEVARRLGVSHATVSFWCSGRSRPACAARSALQRHFGIRAEWWGALPSRWRRRPTYRGAVGDDAQGSASSLGASVRRPGDFTDCP